MNLVSLRPKILACRQIDAVEPALAQALGLDPERHVSAGLITCDQDDALYAALDHATKYAEVDVVYAKSFYAGAAHASGPLSGEVLGVLAGPHPKEVAEGLWALREALLERIAFARFDRAGGEAGPAFFPHVIGETGRYLAPLAGIAVGEPLAYLIAPPLESVLAIDAALKEADVRLCKWFGPPTETNYGGAYLTGTLADVTQARDAFVAALAEVVGSPLGALVRPERERF
jgi:ethanolamine utilization protein EutL